MNKTKQNKTKKKKTTTTTTTTLKKDRHCYFYLVYIKKYVLFTK